MVCGPTPCSLSDPPRLFGLDADRQYVQDFVYLQLDHSTAGRQALVVAYEDLRAARIRVDLALWQGDPVDAAWLPIAVLDASLSGGFDAFVAEGAFGGSGAKLDIVVVLNTYDGGTLARYVRVAAVRLAGCR